MNYTKKYLSLLLVFILCLSIPGNAYASVNSDNNLEQVVIHEDEDKSIVAMVPKEKAKEYKNRISTDEEYRQEEIDKNNLQARLPAGEIMSQRFMYASSIKKAVDSYSGGGTFLAIMGFPVTGVVTDKALAKLLPNSGYATYIGLAVGLLVWGSSELSAKREIWWKDSLIQILQGEISCVRVTHIRNTVSDYPAAYLIIERI